MFPPFLLVWPAVSLSLVCFAVGLAKRSTRWGLFGTVAATPFCLYLAMNPGKWRLIGPAVMMFCIAGVYAMSRGQRIIAAIVLIPFVAVVVWLALQTGHR